MVLWVVLACLTAVAVLSVLVPMARARTGDEPGRGDAEVYRDQLREVDRELARGVIAESEAETARTEIGRRLLSADAAAAPRQAARLPLRGVRTAVILGMPALALALYIGLGSPQLPGSPLASRNVEAPEQQDIETMIAQVEEHLGEDPQDARGWEVIAPIYMQLGRPADAATALRNVIRLAGATPERQADLGEALVAVEEGMVSGEALDLFRAAAEADADLAKPRFYLAIAAEQDGDWKDAAELWRALIEKAPEDAPWRQVAMGRLHAAEEMTDGAAPGPSGEDIAAASRMSETERTEMIQGMVDGLAERLEADGSDLDGWLRLARAYVVLGETDKAREALGSARESFPGDADAERRIDAAARELGLRS